MVEFRHQHHDALFLRNTAHRPVHVERLGEISKARTDFLERRLADEVENHAHEKDIALRVIILLRIENVAALAKQIGRNTGHNAGLVGARKRQNILRTGRDDRHEPLPLMKQARQTGFVV